MKTLINQRVVKVICWNSHLFLLNMYTWKEVGLLCAYWTYCLKRGFNFQDLEINPYSLLHLFSQKNHQIYSWTLALPLAWRSTSQNLIQRYPVQFQAASFNTWEFRRPIIGTLIICISNVPNSLHSFLYHNWYYCFQQKLIHIGFSNK